VTSSKLSTQNIRNSNTVFSFLNMGPTLTAARNFNVYPNPLASVVFAHKANLKGKDKKSTPRFSSSLSQLPQGHKTAKKFRKRHDPLVHQIHLMP